MKMNLPRTFGRSEIGMTGRGSSRKPAVFSAKLVFWRGPIAQLLLMCKAQQPFRQVVNTHLAWNHYYKPNSWGDWLQIPVNKGQMAPGSPFPEPGARRELMFHST